MDALLLEKPVASQPVRPRVKYSTLIALLALAAVWQILSFFFPPYLIPGFQTLIPTFVDLLVRLSTYQHTLASLLRILVSFLISSAFGVGVGLIMGTDRRAEAYVLPFVRFIMGVPALSWVLIGVIWFRSPELRVFFVMFVIIFPILALNTLDGIKNTPKELYDMLLSFRPSRGQLLRMIIIPATLPYILVGAKVALSFATRLVVFVELIGATAGIGAVMYASYQTFNLTPIFVWTAILVGLLFLLNLGMTYLERRLLKWRPEAIRTV